MLLFGNYWQLKMADFKLNYDYLGKSGVRVSNMCLGTMTLGKSNFVSKHLYRYTFVVFMFYYVIFLSHFWGKVSTISYIKSMPNHLTETLFCVCLIITILVSNTKWCTCKKINIHNKQMNSSLNVHTLTHITYIIYIFPWIVASLNKIYSKYITN